MDSHPVARQEGRRTPFARVASHAANISGSPYFFSFCLALILAWAASYVVAGSTAQHVLGDSLAAISLVLLALLQNSELRAEHALQDKLDGIASALRELSDDGEADRRLESAEGKHLEV